MSKLSSEDKTFQSSTGLFTEGFYISKNVRLNIHQSDLTSSRTTTAFSAGAGRGTDKEGPGNETLDNRLFLTPVQLFGILKAQRL